MGKKRGQPSDAQPLDEPLAKASKTSEMIVDLLNGKNALNALKSIAESRNNDDIVQLLSQGGTGKDLLSILVNSAEKLKSPEVSVVFNACEKFLLHVTTCMSDAASPEEASKFTNFGIELCREILEDHLGYIILLLSGTNTAYQVKSSLRLLTAMVTCCGQTAREVLLKVDFEHKNWESVVKRQSSEIRTAFVQFLMSFFVINHPGVAKEFIEKRLLISSILPGLIKDDCELIQLVMVWFKEKILENPCLSKTSKMKLFSVHNLKHLLALFNWRCPDKEATLENASEVKELVTESVAEFFKAALTSSKSGLVFNDLSYGTSGSNLNLLMLNLVQGIVEPWKRPMLANVVIHALAACPDQLRPYIIRQLQPLWQPRHSESWFQVVDFLYAILEKLNVSKIIQDLKVKPKLLTTVLSNFLCNERIFKEVILESLKTDDALVKLKGVELLGLFLNMLAFVMKSSQVLSSVRKQILFRLQDKLPPLSMILDVWNQEAGKGVVQLEDTDLEAHEEKTNYLLIATQVISFYLNHYPDKFSSSDLDLQVMLQKVSQSDIDKDGTVQLLLLKHMMASHGSNQTNQKHLNTLISIACKSLDEENGALAVEAIFTLLVKHDLCLRPDDIKVWLAFVNTDKLGKVCQLLAEEIGELLENKDAIMDEIKKEVSQLSFDDSVGTDDKQDILEKLMRADMDLDDTLRSESPFFSISPLTWKLMKSKALMHHKPYYQKCLVASFVVQSNPKPFLEILTRQDFRSFPLIKSLIDQPSSIDMPECRHQEFANSLKKYSLLAKFKIDPNNSAESLQDLRRTISESDFAMVLSQDLVLHYFNPFLKHEEGFEELHLLIAEIFAQTQFCHSHLLVPYSKKTWMLLNEAFKKKSVEASPLFTNIFEVLPFTNQEVMSLVEALCETPLTCKFSIVALGALLKKLCSSDQWSLANLSSRCAKAIANALEGVLSEPKYEEVLELFLRSISILILINAELGKLISHTHISLACKNGRKPAVEFIQRMLENDMKTHGSNFQKWILSNVASAKAFYQPLKLLLNSDKCKPKFSSVLGEHLIEQGHLDEKLEELLSILVEKYQFDVSKAVLRPCRPMVLQAKASQNHKALVEKVIIPLMKDCVKYAKSNSAESAKYAVSLIKESLEDLDFDLFKNQLVIDEWPGFIKSALKHGLKSDCGSHCLEALDILSQNILNNAKALPEARAMYSLICGHSQFVATLFSSSSTSVSKKEALLALILTLVKFDPKICSSLQVPIYLGSYNATLSLADQIILEILYIHETEGSVNLQAFKPLVWGQAAVLKFSVLKASSAKITKAPKMSEILAAIQPEKMIQSALNFPVTFDHVTNDNYDPRFFLPLLCQLCSPENFVDKHLKLIESGGLALAFASLSCRDEQIRLMGIVALHRIYAQMESARKSLSAEKKVWLHLVDILRNGLLKFADKKNAVPPRIPHMTTAFLVKATRVISNPLDPMFKGVSSFILAKPMMDLFEVPEFLRLFHSSDVTHHAVEQEWILSVIKDGLKDELDYGILQQNFIMKMLLSFYDSVLGKESGAGIRSLVLETVQAMCSMPTPALDMIRNQAILLWLLAVDNNEDMPKVAEILKCLYDCTKSNLSQQTSLEMANLALKLLHESDEVAKIVLPILVGLVDKIERSLRKAVIDVKSVQGHVSQLKDPEIDRDLIKLVHLCRE